jgi:LPS-assembly lipoprotein
MSSFKDNIFRIRLAFAMASVLVTAGCFQPMLAGPSGGALVEELRSIKVQPINDRIGHYLGNELSFALNGSGSDVQEKYKLFITLSQKVQTPIIDTVSGRASAANVLIDAEYLLVETGTNRQIATGSGFSMASYDRTAQRFANLRAARDAEISSARALAEQIRVRLAVDMTRRH